MVSNSLWGPITRKRGANVVGFGFVERQVAGVFRAVKRLTCGLQGHLILLHFEPNKLSLQCAWCGHQSEGWEVGQAPAPRASTVHRMPEQRRTLPTLNNDERLAS